MATIKSIEEKAKAYEEALKRAKKFQHDNAWVTSIFPELKESEDERIRKAIYELVRQSSEILEKKNQESMLAWLEKQGEQNPAWSGEDERMLDEIIDFFENGTVKLQHDLSLYASWLKFIKNRVQPQNTWKPSDEQMKAVKSASLDVAKFSSRSEQLRLENEPYYKALVSLYNDLKKIKEE